MLDLRYLVCSMQRRRKLAGPLNVLGYVFGRGWPWNHRETTEVPEKLEVHSHFRDWGVVWSGACVVDEMHSWKGGRKWRS